jgi:hypothetical protein
VPIGHFEHESDPVSAAKWPRAQGLHALTPSPAAAVKWPAGQATQLTIRPLVFADVTL